MPKYSFLLCLVALAPGLVGCGSKGSDVKDLGDTKTREAESKAKLMDAYNNDPKLRGPGGAQNAVASPQMPPGAAPAGGGR